MGRGQNSGPKVHFAWDVTFAPGENQVVVNGTKNGKAFEDRAIFTLN
jgi:hypothetical protein